MAVAAQEQLSPEAPEPTRRSRQQAVVWPTPAQLRRSIPIIRLLAEIWAIPEVRRIGLWVDGAGVQVWVFLPQDDLAAESKISAAERAYLNATAIHPFELDVVPLARVSEDVLPPFETVLER